MPEVPLDRLNEVFPKIVAHELSRSKDIPQTKAHLTSGLMYGIIIYHGSDPPPLPAGIYDKWEETEIGIYLDWVDDQVTRYFLPIPTEKDNLKALQRMIGNIMPSGLRYAVRRFNLRNEKQALTALFWKEAVVVLGFNRTDALPYLRRCHAALGLGTLLLTDPRLLEAISRHVFYSIEGGDQSEAEVRELLAGWGYSAGRLPSSLEEAIERGGAWAEYMKETEEKDSEEG